MGRLLPMFSKTLLLPLAFGALSLSAEGQVPAFPGAEGYGAYATGGRGGDVYHVINLNSSGAGSLAEGLSTVPAAGRTIVFDVSGYIRISGTLTLGSSKVTIAGQTAPGDGIGVTNGTFLVRGDDVIIRHFRFRDGYSADSLNLDSNSTNSIFDHCDVMLSNDENFSSFNSPPENVTFQWSINAWGMESHSCGGLWDISNGTTHHTLWSHNHTRNPKARPALLDWVNNVTFDWDIGFIMGDSETPADWKANVRGCYFVCPPGNLRSVALEKALLDRNGNPNFSLYVDDSVMDANGDGLLNVSKSGYAIASGSYRSNPTPFPVSGVPVTRDNYLTGYKKVVSAAGPLCLDASRTRSSHTDGSANPLRDEIDTILVSNLVNQVRHHVSSPNGTGAKNGFGVLASVPAPADTDRDGMPDYWETATGSNLNVDDHNNAVPAGAYVPSVPAGFTLLEDYLHFKAIPHVVVARSTAEQPTSVRVDLRRYTSGFTKAPVVFTLLNVTNGVAVLQPDGGTVQFTPTQNFSGRARFDFKVQDGDGSQWTQTFAVLVTSSALPRDLQWKGDGTTNAWNTNALNWVERETTTAFHNGDNVFLGDDGSAVPAIRVEGTLSPGAVEVDATQDYTLAGPGLLTGAMSLRKRGTGRLTVTAANNYGGETLVQEGTLVIGAGGDIGNGPLSLLDGTVTSSYGATTAYNLDNLVQVPQGSSATLSLSPRMTVNGFSGAGTLQLRVAGTVFAYENLNGANYGGFSGKLNVVGSVVGAIPQLTANFNGGSFDGNLAAAEVHLDNVAITGRQNSTGNTLKLGALSGTTSARLAGSGYAGSQTVQVGARNLSTTFAGIIADGVSPTLLQKIGTGELVLAGANTYSGATTVSGGTLRIATSLPQSPVTVAANATLAGATAFNAGITVAAGGRLSPGANEGTAGVMSVAKNLALNSASLLFDLHARPALASDRISLAGGLLTMTGTQSFFFNLLDGVLAPGTYALIDGGTNTSASSVGLVHNLPAGARQSFSLQRPASGNGECYVRLVVSGEPVTLRWAGNNGVAWDFVTTNWFNVGVGDTFKNFDGVMFDDSAPVGLVTISGVVEPRSMVVSNSVREYTFFGGVIGGSGTLVKRGIGVASLTASNAFSGGILLEGGRTVFGTAGALGPGPVRLNGGALQLGVADLPNVVTVLNSGALIGSTAFHNTLKSRVTGSGTLELEIASGRILTMESDFSAFAGDVKITGSGNHRLNQGVYQWGNSNVFYDLGPAGGLNNRSTISGALVYLGGLAGGSAARLRGSDQDVSPGEVDTYVVGGLNRHGLFAGAILDGPAHVLALEKVGTGILTLSGSNTFTGGITVKSGTMAVSNATGSATGSGPVVVENQGQLMGSGLLGGSVSLENGAVFMPGQITIGGDFSGDSGAEVIFVLGTESSRVEVNGDLSLAATIRLTAAAGFGARDYVLFRYAGAGDATAAILDASALPAGYSCKLDTGTAGEVRLHVRLPEFTNVSRVGEVLLLSGSGGVPGSEFYVLGSTNLLLPAAEWTRVSTQYFNASGAFGVALPISPGLPQQFYRLQQ